MVDALVVSHLVCTRQRPDGRPCREPAVVGDDRCTEHWGVPHGRRWRLRTRLARNLIGKEDTVKHDFSRDLEKFGAPVKVDPGVALLGEVHRTAGHVAWLEKKVRELDESSLIWSQVMEATEEGDVPGGPGGMGASINVTRKEIRQEIHKWWQLYQSERSHLARVSLAALKAGIEERRIRLAERGVDILEEALNAALTELGLDAGSERVRAVLGAHLQTAVDANIFGTQGFVDGEVLEREEMSMPAQLAPASGGVPKAPRTADPWRAPPAAPQGRVEF